MRQILNMNFDWKFHYGDIEDHNFESVHSTFKRPQWMKAGNDGIGKWGYGDSQWKDVTLPHDFVNEAGIFSPEADASHASLVTGIAWYRKAFEISESDKGRRLSIEFDGVYRDCTVWVNGHFVGRNLSGYTSFSYDFTDVANYDAVNVVSLRVDATEYEGWWYEGGGIYRDVRLVKTDALHVPQWGTFVSSEVVKKSSTNYAFITLSTCVVNEYDTDANFKLITNIYDAPGDLAAQVETGCFVSMHSKMEFVQNVEIENPKLWSLEQPNLYKAVTIIKKDGMTADEYTTVFGIRTIYFDAQKGFFLNGKPLKIKGVCCHEDHAGVGTAVPYVVNEYRIRRLMEMGCNAYRTSHNPPTPAILELCDKLGMLVMDENRLLESAEEYRWQLESLVKRDRNHPCIIMWSLGNEEMGIQGTPTGARIIKSLQRMVKLLDPTRPVTYAMNGDWDQYTKFHEENGVHLDIKGFNYYIERKWDKYDEYHSEYPDHIILGSENGGVATTRGVYIEDGEDILPITQAAKDTCIWLEEKRSKIVSAYGECFPCWGGTPEETWKVANDREFVAGLFIWTGFDYRGETYPYEWPSVISRYGIMDLCGFEKDIFYYYKAWWTNEPVLHIFPHWNWKGREGKVIDVWAFSNMESVELFVNGKSYGEKTIPFNGHVEWSVEYVPGRINAIGYKNGNNIIEKNLDTTGDAVRIVLTPVCADVAADGEDICIVNVAVVDEQGNIVPDAEQEVVFSVTANANIIGTGNGNPLSHEKDSESKRRLYKGFCQVLIRPSMDPGIITLKAEAEKLEGTQLIITAREVYARPYARSVSPDKETSRIVRCKESADGGI